MSSLPAVKIPCNRIAAGSSLALSSLILLDILVDIPGLLGKNEHRRVLLGWIGNSLMLALVGVGVLASLWALSRPMLVIDDDGIHDRTALFNAMGFIPWERTAGFAVAYGATGRAWGAESALPKKYRGRGVVRIIWSEEGAPSRPVGRLPRLLGRRGPSLSLASSTIRRPRCRVSSWRSCCWPSVVRGARSCPRPRAYPPPRH